MLDIVFADLALYHSTLINQSNIVPNTANTNNQSVSNSISGNSTSALGPNINSNSSIPFSSPTSTGGPATSISEIANLKKLENNNNNNNKEMGTINPVGMTPIKRNRSVESSLNDKRIQTKVKKVQNNWYDQNFKSKF